MRFKLLGLVATFCCVLVTAAAAQLPGDLLRIIVPVSAGGAPDIVARIVAEKLGQKLGQPVVVENRPGAGERLGADFVAKAKPDGRTILIAPPGALVVAQHLYGSSLSYDPAKFVPLSIIAQSYLVLIARPDLPAKNVSELVTLAKSEPGKLTYASPGIGTPPHLTGEMLKLASGIEVTHVPYKGLAPALSDLIAGHVDFMFDNLGNSFGYIQNGRVKALGIASATRVDALPQVPPIAETYPDVVASSWFGAVAPPGTPPDLAEHLSAALQEIVKSPLVAARLNAMSLTPLGTGQTETARLLKQESDRYAAIVGAKGIKLH